MTTDEAVQILERYIEWLNCDELDATPLKGWLSTDIVRMIELMDAELQRRTDEERYEKTVGYFEDRNEGHDPDLDDHGVCRICGRYEPE